MLHEPLVSAPRGRALRRARSPGDRLVERIAILAGSGTLIAHREVAWASITFAGARHSVTWRFRGATEVADGEQLIASLPDHEFHIPGQIVADAAIVDVAHRIDPEELVVTAEILLLQED